MRRLFLRELQGAGVFPGDRGDSEFHGDFVAIGAIGLEAFAAGKQTRKPRGIHEQRPNVGGRRGQSGRARKLHAPPRAASMARASARRVKTRAISRRYSPEACRSESGSTPCAALRDASSINFSEIALPVRARSTASARKALAASPVIPMAACSIDLPPLASSTFAATPTIANPEAGWWSFS